MFDILSAALSYAIAGEPMGWIVLILLGVLPASFAMSGAVMLLSSLRA